MLTVCSQTENDFVWCVLSTKDKMENNIHEIHVVDESETHCKIRSVGQNGDLNDFWIRREELVTSLTEADPPTSLFAQKEYFLSKMALEIKQSLHPTLGRDRRICIQIDTFKDVYDSCFTDIGERLPSDGCWHKTFPEHLQLDSLLGKNWNVRLVNRSGVFCYVIPGTFRVSLRFHRPIKEYVGCQYGCITRWSWKGVFCQLDFQRGFGVGRDYFDLKWKSKNRVTE